MPHGEGKAAAGQAEPAHVVTSPGSGLGGPAAGAPPTAPGALLLYDTTLRDGMQREGLSVSVDEKIRIARRLAELGIHIIEGGFPGSNPKDEEFFQRMQAERLAGHTRVAAFGMTRGKGARAKEDPVLRVLGESWVPVATIVGKTWDLHVRKVLRVDRTENLRMIAESVEFLVGRGKEVIYDAEHFFDAYLDDSEYALQCVRTAAEAGASAVVLCDTNGACLPVRLGQTVAAVVENLRTAALGTQVGIHCHNDSGCAVANTLIGVQKGATHVQGTINGYGERCGNADLCAIIPALKLKVGVDCISDENLARLTETSHFVAELCNVSPDPHQPYVGRNAFAHKGGLHIAAVQEDRSTFEHIRPEQVGNTPRILLSELSGRGAIRQRARELGYSLDEQRRLEERILRRLKKMEHKGYHYEAADASFELLMRDELGVRREFFTLESFRLIVEKREHGEVTTEATIKIHINGERIIQTAEGNGPVNALDRALRLAIERKFPALQDIHLVNYSVRILDEDRGTAAVTRVLLDSSNGAESWGSVGVSDNVVEASWQALVDSIDYGLLRADPEGDTGPEADG
ncbi:MAG: citramalate synthase [Gaiellales bacterium]|nr:citramalate synthase [Gaiellales bacterium]